MKKILISSPIAPKTLEALNQHYHVDCVSGEKDQYEEVWERIADYEGLLAMGLSVDPPLLDRGQKLKIVSNYGVGYDNIDADYAREKNILVTNTPGTTSEPTADLTLGLILSLILKITWNDRQLRNKRLPRWNQKINFGNSPAGKTLGIIGMGRIGKAVARRALTFGMSIVYHQRNQLDAAEEEIYQATFLSFNDLLQRADIISIHTPLNDSTRGLIDEAAFKYMKESCFLINTSRGPVVEEAALIRALEENRIAGAGLDVFEEEPHIPETLLAMENVVLTPHIGTATHESRHAMFKEAFEQLADFMDGKRPENVVNQ